MVASPVRYYFRLQTPVFIFFPGPTFLLVVAVTGYLVRGLLAARASRYAINFFVLDQWRWEKNQKGDYIALIMVSHPFLARFSAIPLSLLFIAVLMYIYQAPGAAYWIVPGMYLMPMYLDFCGLFVVSSVSTTPTMTCFGVVYSPSCTTIYDFCIVVSWPYRLRELVSLFMGIGWRIGTFNQLGLLNVDG